MHLIQKGQGLFFFFLQRVSSIAPSQAGRKVFIGSWILHFSMWGVAENGGPVLLHAYSAVGVQRLRVSCLVMKMKMVLKFYKGASFMLPLRLSFCLLEMHNVWDADHYPFMLPFSSVVVILSRLVSSEPFVWCENLAWDCKGWKTMFPR